MDITELLVFTKNQGASDLHLSSGMPPLVRINGDMTPLDMPPLDRESLHTLIWDIMNDVQKKTFEENHELDFAIDLAGVCRFRVNCFVQRRGEGAVFRVIPSEIKSMQDLALPAVLAEMAMREKGLILVTGPTGSGKSTTLAAMLDHVNRKRRGHIITVEDPIEFVHDSKNCLVNQREIGPHTHSFANALKSALREDPDVILVGELRDLETMQLAITAAETGHVVFGTLHTNSAAKTIDRVIDIFPSSQQAQIRTMFSESIVGIVCQTLLKRSDKKGRVAGLEILVGVPALRNLIREDKTAQIMSVIQTGGQYGMQSMDQCLKNLVMQGAVTREEAARKSTNPALFLGGVAEPAPAAAPATGVKKAA
ncbi:MAG: type IV pilus twitching motility protein PilT [Candidatus Eisenbacteria bacterium]|nr:type IV pilus twitching motility protein PilT [Candidatus Eisenbacteria bacterium]